MAADLSQTPGPSAPRLWRRVGAFVLGMALLSAAVWVVVRQGDSLPRAWASIVQASPWLLAAALGLPVLNLLIVSASFWVLMRREGPVSLGEMGALIGAAWLLNFLPLRPGLIGRLAYHKAVNDVPVARSAWVAGVGMVMGAVAVVMLLATAAALGPGAPPLWWGVACGSVFGIIGVTTLVLAAVGSPAWPYSATLGLRLLDVAVWVARYAMLFTLVGTPISLGGAVAVTAVSQITLMVPLIGNGLGLREWAVGITASSLPAALVAGSGGSGLTVDLVNRAAEIVVAVPVGLACSAWLGRRLSRRRPEAPDPLRATASPARYTPPTLGD